jgi:hypothetical protein
MLDAVPVVLLVTGPVGVGKSAVLQEADALLAQAGVPHATVVLEEIARSGPADPDDPHNDGRSRTSSSTMVSARSGRWPRRCWRGPDGRNDEARVVSRITTLVRVA